MKRGTIEKLKEKQFYQIREDDPLRVELSAYGMPETSGRYFGMNSDSMIKTICQRSFTGFEGYFNDDGTPVPNSIDARIELMMAPWVGDGVIAKLKEISEEIAAGEGEGGSA